MDRLLSTPDAAKKHGLGERRVRDLAVSGLGIRHGRRWKIWDDRLRRYMKGLDPLPPSSSRLAEMLIAAGVALQGSSPEFPRLFAVAIAESTELLMADQSGVRTCHGINVAAPPHDTPPA